MEWSKITFQKVTISKKTEEKTSGERFMQIRKFKLNSASIQETEIFVCRMPGTRNQNRNKTCVNTLETDNSNQLDMSFNNKVTNGDSNTVEIRELANDNVENEEAGVFLSNSQRNEESLNLSEELSELDNSLSTSKKNKSNSEKSEADCSDIVEDTEVEDDCKLENIDASENLDENLDVSISELDNSEICFKNSHEEKIKTDKSCLNENFRGVVIPLNSYKSKKSHDQENCKANKRNLEDGITENDVKAKIDYVNKEDPSNILSTDDFKNEDVIIPCESSVAELGLLKSPCFSTDIIKKYSHSCIKGSEETIKDLHNQNIQTANEEDLKNSIKKCESSLTFSEKGIKRKERDRKTGSQSVTDLIVYFESLNTSKQFKMKFQNMKSKIKQPTSKQDLKVEKIIKSSQNIQSNTCQSLSAQQYSKISHKIDCEKRYVAKESKVTLCNVDAVNKKKATESALEDFSPNVNLGNKERVTEVSPENELPNLDKFVKIRHTEEISDEKTTDIRRDTDVPTQVPIKPEENTSIKTKPRETVPKAILPSLNTCKSSYRLPPITKLGMCAFCKGKCVHIERSLKRSQSNEVKVKEHVFVFSDEGSKETENLRISKPKRSRSCFTNKNKKPAYQLYFPNFYDTEDDKVRLGSDINKTRENRNFLNNNPKQNLYSTENNVMSLSLTENSSKIKKQERNPHERNIPKASERSYVKRFFGTVLTIFVLIILYKGITVNYNLW